MKKLRLIRNIVLVLIAINIIVIMSYFIYINEDSNQHKTDGTQVVDQIDTYGYVLDNNKNDYYKSCFEELKVVLNKDEINYEEYAKVISKLFISDLYTLSNKVSSSDIGGIEFVYEDFRKDFLSIAKTTLYNSVKSNLYGEREQELPTVTNVVINEVVKTTFKYGSINFEDAYLVKTSLEYDKDLGYQKSIEIVLVENEEKLLVVKVS